MRTSSPKEGLGRNLRSDSAGAAENVLLVGSGGREHAIAKALVRGGKARLFAALGNANPGIADCAESVLPTEKDSGLIVEFCRERRMDFCVIGPEQPLEIGLTDALEAAGFPCASPSRAAAEIETSKVFMRRLLDRHGIPGQVRYCQTSDQDEAISFAEGLHWRVAVKPVGLTSGKGVKVWGDHLSNEGEVKAYIRQVLQSAAGAQARVVVEQLMEGQEFTLHFFCDGARAVVSPLIQDHKRAFDGDRGPNTGGMGSYSCADGLLPFVTEKEYGEAGDIGQRVVEALAEEGRPFRGVLYGQFMVTADGPKVIEFNARLGDPEAINALTLLETDYVDVCTAMIRGNLSDVRLRFRNAATVVLYVVPVGYGADPEAGEVISVDEAAVAGCGAELFYGSCQFVDRAGDVATIKTTRSRTLALYAEGDTTDIARTRVLAAIQHLNGRFAYRTDIGSREALIAKTAHVNRLRTPV